MIVLIDLFLEKAQFTVDLNRPTRTHAIAVKAFYAFIEGPFEFGWQRIPHRADIAADAALIARTLIKTHAVNSHILLDEHILTQSRCNQ